MKKQITSILLLVVFIGLPALGWGQGWQKIMNTTSWGASVIQAQDGNLLFLGRQNDAMFNWAPLLFKTDLYGNTIWTKTYPNISNGISANLIEQPNGDLVIAGYSAMQGPNSPSDIFMLFTDAQGNFVDVNYFGGAGYDYCEDIVVDAAGNSYVIGTKDDAGNGNSDYYVLKFGPTGNLLWEKTYDSGMSDYGSTAVPMPNGELVVYGRASTSSQSQVYLVRLDANGNELSSLLGYAEANGDFCASGDGNLFLATHTAGPASLWDLKVVKLDATLNELWSQAYTFPGYDNTNCISPTADGGFILAGRNDDPGAKAILLKADANGNFQWRQRYSFEYLDLAEKAIELANGDFAFVGQNNFNQSQLLYGRTDAQGNVYSHYVTGRIVLDGVDDCILDANPVGLPNWEVRLDGAAHDFIGTADANGNFSIVADTGTYQVTVVPNTNPVFFEQCQPVPSQTLAIFYDTTDIGNILFKDVPPITGTINGYVFYDANGNCQFDAGETPVPCATVPFAREGQFDPVYSDETDANGYYEIQVPINEWYYPGGEFWFNSFWNCSTGSCNIGGFPVNSPGVYTMNVPLTCTPEVAVVAGTVFVDANDNCTYDSLSETPLWNWNLVAVNTATSDSVFVKSLPTGVYNFLLGNGTYEIYVQLPNGTWQTCTNPQLVTIANDNCHTGFDFPIQVAASCPLLEVDISTGSLRPCQMSTYHVQYCNLGSETATNSYVEVVLDSLVEFVSANVPYSQNGQLISFTIGDVDPLECGSFFFDVFLNCDAMVGATFCASAHIYPDTTCVPINPLWDGSSVQLTGKCQGDSILFTLKNVGASNMSQPSEYIVIEDNILIRSEPFQLASNEEMVVVLYPEGATMRMEAQQRPFHPGNSMPSITLEGCGTDSTGNFSIGFVTQYPENDADPFISIECQESVGSYDPNDKRAFPKGVTEGHYIRPNTDLEYQIRFQNTGTAPALKVVVRDSLSPFLKAGTLRPGASSHPYTYALENGNVAVFTFDNINLPDENTAGFDASMGFVKFRIEQALNNLPGTKILNSAAIYFDNNPPIITNETEHNIPLPVVQHVTTAEICLGDEWMGFEVTTDTLIADTVHYAFFDSVQVLQVSAIEPVFNSIEVNVLAGETYHGVVIYQDTVLTEVLSTSLGCDSTVTITVNVLTNGTHEQVPGVWANVFPNPSDGDFWIEIRLTEATAIGLSLYDALGQAAMPAIEQQSLKTGNYRFKLEGRNLPAGCYALLLHTSRGVVAKRVVVE